MNTIVEVKRERPKKIKIPREQELTHEIILNCITNHRHVAEHFRYLQGQYEGKHEKILERNYEDENKPNNKLINDYSGYITTVSTGYFVGKPITYAFEDKKAGEVFTKIFKANNEDDENAELAKKTSIKGKNYELLYTNEDSEIRFKFQDPEEIICIYDDTIEENLLYAIRHVKSVDIEGNETISIEVYSDSTIEYYIKDGDSLREVDIKEHYFKEVPVIEYINNEECLGDFEKVLSLIDAYDKACSDSANDFEYFTDAYLVIIGGMLEDEKGATVDLKKDRILNLQDPEQDAKWLIKQINDAAIENHKTRLDTDIHKFSMVPNLTDENFAGNLTGVAMKFKLWGLEQITAVKERKFKSALRKRLRLINNILIAKGHNFDIDNITLQFHRNIPQNLVELVEMVKNLVGIISDETILELLPFIEDVQRELKRLADERSETKDDPYQDSEDEEEGEDDEE